ncbi:uncharacterized protein LOC141692382 [Apium graveolens]|uniref:uncharacterized protein LOC141692382 n=1 Tax=Apium graveolens TaxID=4045 RepID=UPI003D7A927B
MMDEGNDNDAGVDGMVMDLDLNREPPVSSRIVFGPTQVQIEDRLRQLEEVSARARQRQRWRQTRNFIAESSSFIGYEPRGGTEGGLPNGEETAVGCKRDSSHLVATALEMELDTKNDNGDTGGFFDCNICLDMAKEPVVTCCGHLFCWACFYQFSVDSNSNAKECPVCRGEVTDATITPIYGNGSTTRLAETDTGLKIPPRPPANRIESVRQQRVNQRTHIPVAEALRRIRISIGATTEQPRQEGVNSVPGEHPTQQNLHTANASSGTTSPVLGNAEVGGTWRLRSRQFSRVLSESAASLSSVSSALSNAERLVEDLETYIHGRLLRRTDLQSGQVTSGDIFSSSATAVQTALHTVDSSSDANLVVNLSSISGTHNASVAVLESGAAVEGDITLSRPSSSRRRIGASRISDDSGVSRESRRRRLR